MLLIAPIILFILYSLIIFFYWVNWKKVPDYISDDTEPSAFISIIIAARNEEEDIGNLLQSLIQQDYPKNLFEIIVVDDHSEDSTADIIQSFANNNITLISLTDEHINSYKKKAIEAGIKNATGGLIITTDADCTMNKDWLKTMESFYRKNQSAAITAPVAIACNNSALQIFQSLDFLILQGISAAAVYNKIHIMGNGANLAYTKTVFNEVNGFENINNIASGDDMLLLGKINTYKPGSIQYLKSKEAIVSTTPVYTWKDFFNQRIRWASKATMYNDKKLFSIMLIVYLFNFSFLFLFVAGFFNSIFWLWFLVLLFSKTIIEFPFVYAVSSWYGKRNIMPWFLLFQPLHIAYTIIAGWLGQFGKYEWKGRRVK